jgi:glutaredoxin 3
MTLTVYTKNHCPFCDRAKALLESRSVEYRTVNIEEDADAREFLRDAGLRSVPQIYNGTTLLPGGFQGLSSQPEAFWTKLKLSDLGSL